MERWSRMGESSIFIAKLEHAIVCWIYVCVFYGCKK